MKFIKDSIRELKHVVWPTKEETKKYFISVVAILIAFGIYLFIFSNIFSEGLLFLKNIISPSVNNITIDPSNITISTGNVSTWETNTWNVVVPTSTGNTSTGSTN